MQPCSDWERLQQGNASEQQAVSGAATAPNVIHASSAVATKRMNEARNNRIGLSLPQNLAAPRLGLRA